MGIICGPRIYEYKGWVFEYGYGSVWPLKKNGDLRKRAGRKFYNMIDEFTHLQTYEQDECRVGGGCKRF